MSDQKIMALFKCGQREKAFSKLYRLYPGIEKLILSKGGSKADASDVFQESLIILYRNLQSSDFKLTSSFYTYLYSVSRFVYNDLRKQLTRNDLRQMKPSEVEIFQSVIEEKKYKNAEMALSKLGARCQELLYSFYLKSMSFRLIAEKMGFSSEKVAKNQKYKCLKKAKEIYNNQFTITQF